MTIDAEEAATAFVASVEMSAPPFDVECEAALASFRATFPTLDSTTLPEIRTMDEEISPSNEVLERGGFYQVHEREARGPHGAPAVPMLVCKPVAARAPTAAVYYVHGGGMVVGSRRSELEYMMHLAEAENLAVVSVGYRLAPEHPDPAPIEDSYAGLLWMVDNAHEFNIDPDRILVFGMSAGGGIAAGLALLCRDRGAPNLIGQLLACPMLDDRNDSISSIQFDGRGSWTRESNEFGWSALLGPRHRGAAVSQYASPTRADDLSGLPPAFIDVGSAEVFRDESVDYASRMWAAGGVCELHVWPGGYHGYDAAAPTAAISRGTNRARADWLHRLLKKDPSAVNDAVEGKEA